MFSSPFRGIIIKSEGIDGFDPEEEFVLVPFRGNHYQIGSELKQYYIENIVLVPFRGNHYQIAGRGFFADHGLVLVPFRGNHYQITATRSRIILLGFSSRPLSGESLSNRLLIRVTSIVLSSRPLSGESLSNRYYCDSIGWKDISSRPLSGESLSNPIALAMFNYINSCSRPLSGESLSNHDLTDGKRIPAEMFSSPFGGIIIKSGK